VGGLLSTPFLDCAKIGVYFDEQTGAPLVEMHEIFGFEIKKTSLQPVSRTAQCGSVFVKIVN
jgi:hypothetical protein